MEGKQRYTLSDVYHAAKTERHFNYVFWMHITLDILGAAVMKYAGYSLVVVAVGLVAIISILGFFVVLPTLFEPWSYAIIGHTLWGTIYMVQIATLTTSVTFTVVPLQVYCSYSASISTTLWQYLLSLAPPETIWHLVVAALAAQIWNRLVTIDRNFASGVIAPSHSAPITVLSAIHVF